MSKSQSACMKTRTVFQCDWRPLEIRSALVLHTRVDNSTWERGVKEGNVLDIFSSNFKSLLNVDIDFQYQCPPNVLIICAMICTLSVYVCVHFFGGKGPVHNVYIMRAERLNSGTFLSYVNSCYYYIIITLIYISVRPQLMVSSLHHLCQAFLSCVHLALFKDIRD